VEAVRTQHKRFAAGTADIALNSLLKSGV